MNHRRGGMNYFPPTGTFYGGRRSNGWRPNELNPAPTQNSGEYLMTRGLPPATNSASNLVTHKRKAEDFSVCHQPPVAPPPVQASVSQSHSMHDYSPMIDAIKEKHGDIVKDCNFRTEWMRTLLLFSICNILNELQMKQLDELDIVSLEHYRDVVLDVEQANVNVKWLLQGLDQIKDAITSRDEAKVLNNEKSECMKEVEKKMKEVETLKSDIEDLDGKIEKLNESISTRTSKFQQLQSTSLMDMLIYHTR